MALFLLFNSPALFAQSGITLSWDSEMGCLDYGVDKHRELPVENIGDEDCLLVCQESTVNFTVDFGTQPVTNISWETEGGQIVSLSSGDATAQITWPLAYPNGNVAVQITLANGQVINGSICVTVKDPPQGGFEILGQVSQYFCSETELFFENQAFMLDGTQIVASVWDFGDGTTSSEFNPTHTYFNEGLKEISLTVYDECGCKNIWKTDIYITKPGIVMSCPTVVCEGSTQVYTVEGPAYLNGDVQCSQYIWTIEGGHLLNQGQDWVEVIWDSIDEDGFGYVYFDQASCNVYCNNQLGIKVPVIPTQGTITGGDTEICQSDQSRYALPQWPTTDVTWSVSPADEPNIVLPDATILVDQRNEIVVDASGLPPGDYILSADYTNTLLKCGGNAEFPFTVLQDLEINESQFTDEVCEGNTADFYLMNTIAGVTWTISQGGQTVATVSGSGSLSHGSYQFSTAGHYTVTATANGYCTGYTQVDVIEIPSVVNAAILGAVEICPAQSQSYTFDGETNGFNVVWSVDNGIFQGPNVGETVTIKFDAGFTEYEVSTQLINPNFDSCESDFVILPVELFEPEAQIIQTTGNPNAICSSSEENFELQGYSGMDYYEWTIEPAELAHVSNGEGTENVTILFNEPYLGQTQGTITVKAKVCGEMTEIDQVNFELDQSPILTITDAPSSMCPNSIFTIEISSNIPIPPSALSISFSAPLSNPNWAVTSLSQGNTDFVFSNISLANVNPFDDVSVSYTITASGPDLCGETQISGTINRYPAPEIQAYFEGANTFCTAQEIDTELFATIQGDGVDESDIYWDYMGNKVGTGPMLDLATLSNAGFGTYTAIAVNSFLCKTLSNPIIIHQDCTPPLPSCINEGVVVTEQWTGCNMIELTATYTGNPVSVELIPLEGFTALNTTPLPPTNSGNVYTQEFETNSPGTYLFGFKADYVTCEVAELLQVDVEYKPLMLTEVICHADGTYTVTILNQSIRMPNSNPQVDYTFSKNPGGLVITPDSQNDNEATTTLSEGDYTLTLTLTSPGKPTCEVSQPLPLYNPDAAFTIIESPICSENPVILQPDNPTPGATYLWDFQDATNTLENINPNLAGTDDFGDEIILTVTDPFGCSDFSVETIVVNDAVITALLTATPSSEICVGESTDLGYQLIPGSPSTPDSYLWYKNYQFISGETNPTLSGVSESGEYALHIFDENGCEDATISSIYINQIQPPHLTAEITSAVCAGQAVMLSGTFSPDGTEYQITRSKNGGPYLIIQSWTEGPELNVVNGSLSPGAYSYKVEYKDPLTDCSTITYFDAVVHPAPSVSVQLDNVTCSPYAVQLTATGNQPGTYIWSNGMSGPTITVDHGGPYQVTFWPDGADCEATSTFEAPKSPDVYSWIFPTGCLTYCKQLKDLPYIIGPIPYFEGGYQYDLNGNGVVGGIGVVDELHFEELEEGGLTLTLNNAFCNTTTDFLDITVMECEECDGLIDITDVEEINNPTGFVSYSIVAGTIHNPLNHPVTFTLSSIHGSFIPSVISIPPGGVYNFATNPVMFIPFSPFQGYVLLEYVINVNGGDENKILCMGALDVNMMALSGFWGGGIVAMRVIPNPVESSTQVHYVVEDVPEFNGGTIKLYSLNGSLIAHKNVNEAQGQTRFDMAGLASGTYVVVFFSHGQRLGQQILIKN